MKMLKYAFLILVILENSSSAMTCQRLPHIILSGLPGSGKGTLSQVLVGDYGYVQICPGDLLRAEVKASTSLGDSIKHILEQGEYVDDEVLFNFLRIKIDNALSQNKVLIFDGYPRSKRAKELLFGFLQERGVLSKTILVNLHTTEEIARERILNRLVCPECKYVFSRHHSSSNHLPKDDSGSYVCPHCGAILQERNSDKDHIVTKRFAHFHKEIEPLLGEISSELTTYEINRDLGQNEFLQKLNSELQRGECVFVAAEE